MPGCCGIPLSDFHVRNNIEKELTKIMVILSDIEKRNKDPRYAILLRRIRREMNMPLPQLCDGCGQELHERDGHYCKDGEWV